MGKFNNKLPFILYLTTILAVIIAIPNASDDVTIPTAIPTPSPVMNNIQLTTCHGFLYVEPTK